MLALNKLKQNHEEFEKLLQINQRTMEIFSFANLFNLGGKQMLSSSSLTVRSSIFIITETKKNYK